MKQTFRYLQDSHGNVCAACLYEVRSRSTYYAWLVLSEQDTFCKQTAQHKLRARIVKASYRLSKFKRYYGAPEKMNTAIRYLVQGNYNFSFENPMFGKIGVMLNVAFEERMDLVAEKIAKLV